MKENKGITLIALVITIIVLLILAGVTVSMVLGNEGILTKAENAKEQTNSSQELGQVELAVLEAKTNNITGGQDLKTELEISINKVYPGSTVKEMGSGYIITLENGNLYKVDANGKVEKITEIPDEDLDLLEKYFLGENKEGIDLMTRVLEAMGDLTYWKWKDDPNSITDASTSLECLNYAIVDVRKEDAIVYDIYDIYMLYNDKVYAVRAKVKDFKFTTESISFKYAKTGREGQIYKYDANADGVDEDWTILYDYGQGKGIEIVSPDTIGGFLALGYEDTQAVGTDNMEKAIYSYNNAVKRINDYCKEQITNTETPKENIRSVGTKPGDPYSENNTKYESDNLKTWAMGKYNAKGKSADLNFEEDFIRMSYHKVTSINKQYWMPSRLVDEKSSGVDFRMRLVLMPGNYSMTSMYHVEMEENNSQGNRTSNNVRPIVKIPNV